MTCHSPRHCYSASCSPEREVGIGAGVALGYARKYKRSNNKWITFLKVNGNKGLTRSQLSRLYAQQKSGASPKRSVGRKSPRKSPRKSRKSAKKSGRKSSKRRSTKRSLKRASSKRRTSAKRSAKRSANRSAKRASAKRSHKRSSAKRSPMRR